MKPPYHNIDISISHLDELEAQKKLSLQIWRIGEAFRQVLVTLGQQDIVTAILAKAYNEEEFVRVEEGAEEEDTSCNDDNDELYPDLEERDVRLEELTSDLSDCRIKLADVYDANEVLRDGLHNANVGNEALATRIDELEGHLKAIHKIVWQARNGHSPLPTL